VLQIISESYKLLWRGVWKLMVPNKLWHFIWRFYNESLPTKSSLLYIWGRSFKSVFILCGAKMMPMWYGSLNRCLRSFWSATTGLVSIWWRTYILTKSSKYTVALFATLGAYRNGETSFGRTNQLGKYGSWDLRQNSIFKIF